MDCLQLTRRRFVVFATALVAAAGSSFRPGTALVGSALADSTASIDEGVRATMVRMARLLFPHDALSDDVYLEILDAALSQAASSNEVKVHLDAAAKALAQHSDLPWHTLDEAAQLEAMRGIETEPFFAAITNHVRLGVYSGAAFWKHINYPGPSKGFGGYLYRGAGEIDWLPEDK